MSKPLTTFRILVEDEPGVWVATHQLDARNRVQALRLYGKANPGANGRYVAVSEAAWKPFNVQVDPEPKVTVTPA